MISEAKKRANKKWNENNIEQVNLSLPKGTKETLDRIVAQTGTSRAAFVLAAIHEKCARDGIALEDVPQGE
jgi:uncharacterized protein (DUF1778 family)